MRIAFDGRPVHVSARIAFVGVADDVFDLALDPGCRLPLYARGEPGAAAATEPRSLHHVDDLLGRHLEESLLEGEVAFPRDVFLDVLGVDHAAVAQDDAELLLIELDILNLDVARGVRVFLVEESLDLASLDHLFGDDLFGRLRASLRHRTIRREAL